MDHGILRKGVSPCQKISAALPQDMYKKNMTKQLQTSFVNHCMQESALTKNAYQLFDLIENVVKVELIRTYTTTFTSGCMYLEPINRACY